MGSGRRSAIQPDQCHPRDQKCRCGPTPGSGPHRDPSGGQERSHTGIRASQSERSLRGLHPVRSSLIVGRPSSCTFLRAQSISLQTHAEVVLDEGLFDKAALDLRAEGLDALQGSLQDYTLENISKITGVDAELIRTAAKDYAETPKSHDHLSLG